MNLTSRIGISCVLALFAASCVTRPPAVPTTDLKALAPETWSQGSGGEPEIDWIGQFADDTLTALIAEAMAENFGLEAASHQVNAAEAAARISGALKYPSLSVGLSSSRQKSFFPIAPQALVTTTETYTLALSSQWELDLWQRLSNAHAASIAQYQASRYDYEALRLSLTSQVAKAWFNAIEAQAQYRLAQATADSLETQLETLERSYERGLTDAFDLRLTRSQVAVSRASAITRHNEMNTTLRVLETLVGRYPDGTLVASQSLPDITARPPAGLPVQLLSRRPDLQAQERRLAAAFAEEKSTRRNWLPSLALTGTGGSLSTEFSELLSNGFNVWSLAGDLTMPLFNGGRLRAERDQAFSLKASQLAQYNDLVLQAFREVETALQSELDLSELEDQSAIAAEESGSAEEQAWSLYERGLIDISNVLDAQRRAFDARSQFLDARNLRLQNRIDLHIALGGGFDQQHPSESP